MNTASLSQGRLAELLSRFASARLAVVGDFFLDRYLDVDPALDEVSVETGKTAYQVAQIRCSPGAAGTVVRNLAALGAGRIHAIGFCGDDGPGHDLRKALKQVGCSTDHLHATAERHTPTYLKPRDLTRPGLDGEHSRYDTKNRLPTPPEVEQKILASIHELVAQVDAMIIMDQVESAECGVLTTRIREAMVGLAANLPGVRFWADSRRRIRLYRNVAIKPNQFEAVGNDNPRPGDSVPLDALLEAASALRRQTNAPLFVTLGKQGMIVSDPEWTLVPGVRIEGETDPTGAGDSTTAGCVLALCAGAQAAEAGVVGNLVASITVQQLATTGTAQPGELAARLAVWQSQQR